MARTKRQYIFLREDGISLNECFIYNTLAKISYLLRGPLSLELSLYRLHLYRLYSNTAVSACLYRLYNALIQLYYIKLIFLNINEFV